VIRVEALTASHGASFDAFVEAHPLGSVFHTRDWIENACASVGAEPRTLVAWDVERGAIVGALPLALLWSAMRGRRLLSIPFCRYLPPLGDSPATVAALTERAAQVARDERCAFLELRSGPLPELPLNAEARTFFDNWSIDLSGGEEACWSRLHARGTRRAIRFARGHGVEVRRTSGREGFAILARLDGATRRRQGVPRHPPAFIRGLDQRFEASGRTLLLIAFANGEPIAAELALRHGRTWHGILGVDAGREARSRRASTLLVWEAIRHAIADGASRFDLGPAHRANLGLADFKRHFGATATPAGVVTLTLDATARAPDDEHLDRPAIRLARRTLAALPDSMHRMVSQLLAREVA